MSYVCGYLEQAGLSPYTILDKIKSEYQSLSTAAVVDDTPTLVSALGILFGILLCIYTLYDAYRRPFACPNGGILHLHVRFPFNYIPITTSNTFSHISGPLLPTPCCWYHLSPCFACS